MPEQTFGQKAGSLIRELIIVVIGAIIVSSLLRAFVGQMFLIPSGSMENTLMIGDRVVVQKITDFQRGSVVVFEDPDHWLGSTEVDVRGPIGRALEFIGVLPDTSTGHLIKRVIGLPGDRVKCCDTDGRIMVNGRALDETSYLYTGPDGSQVDPSDIDFEVVVPRDRIFVMGDHRNASADSRCHLSDLAVAQPKGANAFVPIDKVVGPAFAIVAPFDRARLLKAPATFAKVPPAAAPAPAKAVITPADVTC